MRAAMAERIWQTIKRNKTLQYGVPMLLLIIGGSFGLREFTQIRYDAHKRHGKIDPALEEKIKKNKVSLESEYEDPLQECSSPHEIILLWENSS
ncbi:cytochrome c oxidase assembly protein COX16 homolog, mitochondrial isoform X2 [Rhinatrema bivittatum]|uniref:cytochrome c oxidase assembly protein COX16 homolog, mitochondrial isoform X2 n=1 Tax=Rhinatrema bivittatum TaxID=194408 RepID=UPI00112BF23F|nr:cytochrome c oxidase assembly protein COX16 homolog, mitochondrial isoform X2 [Rhinatrema bivittatum]